MTPTVNAYKCTSSLPRVSVLQVAVTLWLPWRCAHRPGERTPAANSVGVREIKGKKEGGREGIHLICDQIAHSMQLFRATFRESSLSIANPH